MGEASWRKSSGREEEYEVVESVIEVLVRHSAELIIFKMTSALQQPTLNNDYTFILGWMVLEQTSAD